MSQGKDRALRIDEDNDDDFEDDQSGSETLPYQSKDTHTKANSSNSTTLVSSSATVSSTTTAASAALLPVLSKENSRDRYNSLAPIRSQLESHNPLLPSPRSRGPDSIASPTHLGFQFYLYGPDLGRGSTSASIARLSLLNGIVGVGLFALADFFVVVGIPLGIAFILMYAYAFSYSYRLLHELSVRTQQLSYGQIALKIGGPWVYFLVDIMLLLNVLVAVCSIVIGIRDVIDFGLTPVTDWIEANTGIPKELNILVWVCTIYVLILCNTEKASIPNRGIFTIVPYFIGLLVLCCVHTSQNYKGNIGHFMKCRPSKSTIEYIPLAVFTFDCFGQFMTIYAELPQPVADIEARQFVNFPIGMASLTYVFVAFTAVFTNDISKPEKLFDSFAENDQTSLKIIFAVNSVIFIILFGMKCAIWFRSITKTITFMKRVLVQKHPLVYLNDLKSRSNLIINTSPPSRRLIAVSSVFFMSISCILAYVGADINVLASTLATLVVIPLGFIILPCLHIYKLQNRTAKELRGSYALLAFGLVTLMVCCVGVIVGSITGNEFEICS